MIVYDTNGEQPLSAMISMITKVSLSSFIPPDNADFSFLFLFF